MKVEPQKTRSIGDGVPEERNWRATAAIVFVFIGVFYWVIKIVF